MRQLLYFIEGREALGRDEAERLGIGHAFPDGVACRRAGDGPGRQGGVVCARDADGLGYWPERQEWHPAGSAGLWIGWHKDAKPRPEDLARERQTSGHWVTLSDGCQWLIPAAQRWDDAGFVRAVPSRLRLNAAGEWSSGEVLPDFARLWAAAQRWFDFVTVASEQGTASVAFGDAANMACEALAANYRVTRIEVAALGLLDDRQVAIAEILDALIDMPTFLAWSEARREKKQPPAGEGAPALPAGLPTAAGAAA